MSTELNTSPAVEPDGPITLDQFAAELVAEQQPDNEAAAQKEEDEEETPEVAEESGAEELEAEADSDEEEAAATETPEIPPPRSWSAEDRAAWAALTPEARAVVAKREADRDRAVSIAATKVAELGKQVQAYASQVEELAALGASAFAERWGEDTQPPIDWSAALRGARTDQEFDEITRQKAMYDAERTEVERASRAAAEQSKAAHAAFLAEEGEKLPTLAPELCDPKTGDARRKAVAEFLVARGIEPEALKFASAAELAIASLALDGLKYREAQKQAKVAAAAPRKNPTVSPAKPVRASGVGDASPQRNLQALSQRLTKSGRLDDFVALELAEQEQKARKKAR